MFRWLTRRGRITLLSVGAVIICWGMFEVTGEGSLSLRLGFLMGLVTFPILQRIYDYGFRDNHRNAYKAMGLSFVVKGTVLFGSYLCLEPIAGLSFREYMFPLFFTVFLLGFVAIYLARLQSDFSFATNRGFITND